MNRKKITLILSGLAIVSSMFVGCGSSNKNTTSDNKKVSQQDSGFKRTTERDVTEYDENNDFMGNESIAQAQEGNIDNNGTSNGFNVQPPLNGFGSGKMQNDRSLGGDLETLEEAEGNSGTGTQTMFNSAEESNNSINSELPNELIEKTVADNSGQVTNQQENVLDNTQVRNFRQGEMLDSQGGDQPQNGVQNQVVDQVENIERDEPTTLAVSTIEAGKITPVRSIGGMELTGTRIVGTHNEKPQGTIQVSFTLEGEVLDMVNSGKTLSQLIKDAYDETLKDANTGFKGSALGSMPAREALQAGLASIFNQQSGNNNVLLRDTKGQTVSIKLQGSSSTDLAPDKTKNPDYVRHIIDLDAMTDSDIRETYSARVSIKDIPVSLILRANEVNGSGNDELKTNTTYTFVGISGEGDLKDNKTFPIKDSKYLTGFYVPPCTTMKQPCHIDVKTTSSSQLYELSSGEEMDKNEGTKVEQGAYAIEVNDTKWYIDMLGYSSKSRDNDLIIPQGTSIKLKGFKFTDPDDSVAKIDIEDDYGTKYPCSMTYIDPSKPDTGKCLQINGLKPETGYIFSKLHITSNIDGQEETNSIYLREKSSGKSNPNTQRLVTTSHADPTITLATAGEDGMVELPGGLKVPAVRNDSTSLRYIVKANYGGSDVGDLRVVGLKNGESYKVERIPNITNTPDFYFAVTLTNLNPDTNYEFASLELDYYALSGDKNSVRVPISKVNPVNGSTASSADNTTEKSPASEGNTFDVSVATEFRSDYPRRASVPVFVDDMNGRFMRVDLLSSGSNPDIRVKHDGFKLDVTGLKPVSTETLTLGFVYKSDNGQEKTIKKYVNISTPVVGEVDVKSDIATVTENGVTIKLDYFTPPKSDIKSVIVKDQDGREILSSWDSSNNSITLSNLEPNKEYKGLTATFTLENTNKVSYMLTPFSTNNETAKPTGKVAEFVQRVYKIALGREPEVVGWNFWINKLQSKELTATEFIAENLMTQNEFIERQLTREQFVTTMYSLIVNRTPDQEGQFYWERKYDEYKETTKTIAELRIKIAREMMQEPEFKKLITDLGLEY